MDSILIATMNVNQPDLTNNLVETLQQDTYIEKEIMVLENGATELSKYSTHISEKNYFYGGGLNLIFDYFLNETDHKWLMVMNNDLIINGNNYVKRMIMEAELFDMCQLSPAVINASISQCAWKQMHNWMSGNTRKVQWIDFQAPLLRRDFCQIIKQYPIELIYGWGNDILSGIIAEQHMMNVGVTDLACITHLNSQTINKGIIDLDGNPITSKEYCSRAEHGMMLYMSQDQKTWAKFNEYRHNAFNYSYNL